MAAQYQPQRHQGPTPQQHQHGNEHDNPPGGRSQAYYDNQPPIDRQNRYGNQRNVGHQQPYHTNQLDVESQPSQYVQQQPQYGNQESMGGRQQPQFGEPMLQPQPGNQEPMGRQQPQHGNQEPMGRQQPQHGNQGQQQPPYGVPYQEPMGREQPQYGNQEPMGRQQPQYGNQEPMGRQQPQHGNQEPMGRQQPQHGNQEPMDRQQPQHGNQEPMGRQQPQHGNQEPMGRQQPQHGNQEPMGRQQPQHGNQEPMGRQQPQHGNQEPMGRQQPQHGNQWQQQPPYGVPYQEPMGRQQPQYGNQENIVPQQPQYDNQQATGQNFRNGNQGPTPHYGNQHPVPRPRQRSLPRSISSTNLEKTSQCRSVIQQDWVIQAPPGGTNFFATVPIFTLTLPNLDAYPPEFQQFVFDRLIDKGVQQSLEQEKCLNWCRSATRLVPLITTGDGNCLLHSASLGMWGFQDRNFILRRAVHTALANSSSTQLHRRWKHSREIENRQMGIELEDHQWDQEWRMVVSQASLDTTHGQPLDSLDDFHIFVLANVLRRPILMYAAPKIRSQATGGTLQQINFHGIYLPLLWESNSCKKDPLPLAYIGGHFVALVAIEYRSEYSQGMFTLPLADVHGEMLPVRFALRMEEPTALIMDYLRTTKISSVGSPFIPSDSIVCAQLSIAERPAYLKPLLSGFIDACKEAHFGNQPQQRTPPQPYDSRQPNPPQPTHPSVNVPSSTSADDQDRPKCINSCGLYGDPEKAGLCHQCYQKQVRNELPQQSAIKEEDMFFSKQSSPQQHESTQKCINHCGMQGDPRKGGLCSQCYQKQLRNEQEAQHGGQQQQQHFRQNFQPSPPNGGKKCINDCGAYADPGSDVGMCSECLQKGKQVASAKERRYSQNELNAPPQQNFGNGGGNSLNYSGSIKCPKCSNPGHPNYLGMCETCYQGGSLDRESSPGKDNHIYETIPGPPNTEQPQDRNARKNCPTPNCEFFGTADTLFYCSKCFERDMERILKEADNSPAEGFQTASQPQAPPVQFEQRIRNIQPQPLQPSAQHVHQQPPQPSAQPHRNAHQQPPQPSAQPHRNAHQQPPQPSAQPHRNAHPQPSAQPYPADDKCPQCRNFYANPEYGGLCSDCFMQKTKTETRTERFVQKPIYEPCQTKDCNNNAEVHGLCNACVTNQQPRQKTAPVYQPHYEKCMNINCGGLRTQSGYCDNCNMHTGRTYAATQQHHGPQQSERPIPKPRRNTQSMATSPIMHLNTAMESMSVSGTQCFMCAGHTNDGGSNVLCRKHAEMMTPQHPVRSTPQGQPNYHQQQGQGGVPRAQSGPQPTHYGNQPFTGQNQAGFAPQGQRIPFDHYGNPQQQPEQRRAPPPQFDGTHQFQDRGNFEAHGGNRNHPNQQALPPNIPQRAAGNPPQGIPPAQPRPGEVPFGVNIEPPHQQTVGGGAVGGGGAFEKLLCATPGCSFKGYRELTNLCPDCYELNTRLKAPDRFPLV